MTSLHMLCNLQIFDIYKQVPELETLTYKQIYYYTYMFCMCELFNYVLRSDLLHCRYYSKRHEEASSECYSNISSLFKFRVLSSGSFTTSFGYIALLLLHSAITW